MLTSLLRVISLLLPALIPSWRFFKTVAPSPRVEYRVIAGPGALDWCEDRPRPQDISVPTILWRMLWNPDWNEQLFLVSCAERMIEEPSQHSLDEILTRVARLLPVGEGLLQIRLVFISRDGEALVKSVEYESEPVPLSRIKGRAA
ncbi:hypothetical protein KMP13_18125 [Epibacterium ulvae]|uniref:hypothetical protein n=1 Tax=Epibacterium ulvae TaxID=1156985 RepID=UPI001BFC4ED6|nr:hypothetical protein [Epibacterium ulvae]MBT8155746.1 hypothetical protein [Epibacterium ulvae]